MKLKELPASLSHMFKLWFKDPEKLNEHTESDLDIVVSLTSIPSRLNIVHLTIRSVLNQSSPPKLIVLWLHKSMKSHIPNSLSKLTGSKFIIKYTDLDCPHCKLVPSLTEYPNETIVTCDDDLLYCGRWLENLFKTHINNLDAIIAYHVREIKYNGNGKPLPYKDWNYDRTAEYCGKNHVAMGYGGVLYPPNSMPIETTNSDLFMKLCPKADDLWFKAMQALNNIKIVRVSEQISIDPIPGSQAISLKRSNVNEDKNSEQWDKLCKEFPNLQSLQQD